MNYKLLQHDFRTGLLRKRYLWLPLLFIIPCYISSRITTALGMPGTWLDYLCFFFFGCEPIYLNSLDKVILPVQWLSLVGGLLLVNLDYLLYDLDNAGQQIIVRSASRTQWFISKCMWNIASTMVYFIEMAVVAWFFCVIKGGESTLTQISEVSVGTYNVAEITLQDGGKLAFAAILMPFFTLAAASLLQMALCIFIPPVFSFFFVFMIMELSVLLPFPVLMGNAAMAIRSGILHPGFMNVGMEILANTVVMVGSIVMGAIGFRRKDIIKWRE
ncbi:MAG: hypothetical protein IJM90_05010 [Firmicutes bacterium]|nr:hypothetical protein [Bacillota bacterium]